MSWIFALLGLLTAAAGGGAIAMGWPLVPLERGWTLVIAGSALVSGGLICLTLAALMGETRRTRRAIERALEELAWARPIERMSAKTLPAEHEIVAAAERAYAPSPAPSPRFDKGERVTPPMPVMPAAAPLGVPEPPIEAKPVAERREARQEPRLDPHPAGAAAESAAHEAHGSRRNCNRRAASASGIRASSSSPTARSRRARPRERGASARWRRCEATSRNPPRHSFARDRPAGSTQGARERQLAPDLGLAANLS